MTDDARTCPDCRTPLRRIQLVDHQGGAAARVGLAYLLEPTPKMGMWRAEVVNRAGDIHGHLCEQCHRVLFYAEPRA